MPSAPIHPDLILFGGAFDPPHMGHRQCLEFAADEFPKSELWLMPGAQPAGARGQHKNPSASFAQRVDMCELLVEGVPRTKVSMVEGELPPPNYTCRTLEYLKEQVPDRSIAIMIGQDQLRAFPRWQEPLRVLELAHLIVVRRIDHRRTNLSSLRSDAASALTALQLDWQQEGELIRILNQSKAITLLDINLSDAESTRIRELIAANEPLPAGWLPPQILNYINTQGLYQRRPSL